MTVQTVAVLSGSLRIRLTQSQLESLLKQWRATGKPGDRMTLQIESAYAEPEA